MQTGRLQGKVAVITGGNRGLGFSSARRFVGEGAKVITFARDEQRNTQAVAELRAIGGDAMAVAGSVTSLPDIERMVAEAVKRYQRIDVLFVNHGIVENLDFLDMTEEIYDRMMDTNTKGAFFVVQKAVPHMPPGSSMILCTSSSLHIALGDMIHYTASKQALDSFRRTMSKALVGRGIPFVKTGPFAYNGLFGFWVVASAFFIWVSSAYWCTLQAVKKQAEQGAV